MATKRRGDDDPAWNESGIGGDPNAPKRPPGSKADTGLVTSIGETFWRAMDTVPLSYARWSSRPKMNANIKYMLRTHARDEIEASFNFFRGDTPNLVLQPSCWDVYFRQRGRYLRMAQRAQEGARPGQVVHRAGDIRVDNDRFHVHNPGEVPPDLMEPDPEPDPTDPLADDTDDVS